MVTKMSEIGPILELQHDGDTIYAHRFNTALFSFIGEHACYDHVFILHETQDEVTGETDETYLYLFKSHSLYPSVRDFIEASDFPQHLNLPDASEMDIEVFENAHYGDIRNSDFPPKEWSHE